MQADRAAGGSGAACRQPGQQVGRGVLTGRTTGGSGGLVGMATGRLEVLVGRATGGREVLVGRATGGSGGSCRQGNWWVERFL